MVIDGCDGGVKAMLAPSDAPREELRKGAAAPEPGSHRCDAGDDARNKGPKHIVAGIDSSSPATVPGRKQASAAGSRVLREHEQSGCSARGWQQGRTVNDHGSGHTS